MNFFQASIKIILLPFLGITMFIVSCERDQSTDPPPTPDIRKEITKFSLKRADGSVFLASEVSVVLRNDSIFMTLPAGTDLSRLIPEITIEGKSVSPASGTMQNFTVPVIYTVTAADGSTRKFVVAVSLAPTLNSGSGSSSSLVGLWGVLIDSITNTGDYYFRENGTNYFPITGVIIGTTLDYYDFKSDGKLTFKENGISGNLTYVHRIPDTILFTPATVYDTAIIKTFTSTQLTLYWKKKSSNGGVLTRTLYLKR